MTDANLKNWIDEASQIFLYIQHCLCRLRKSRCGLWRRHMGKGCLEPACHTDVCFPACKVGVFVSVSEDHFEGSEREGVKAPAFSEPQARWCPPSTPPGLGLHQVPTPLHGNHTLPVLIPRTSQLCKRGFGFPGLIAIPTHFLVIVGGLGQRWDYIAKTIS